MKLWGGRFTAKTHELVDEYNASISFDYRLAEDDIQGSLAHVSMLGKTNILNPNDVLLISDGLKTVLKKIQNNEIQFSLADEDIHMNIERLLTDEIGEVAGKLHTGRSRNDQVALDMRLYLRREVVLIVEELLTLQKTLIIKANQNVDTIMPGYTHLQRAQPILFAHHLLAYCAMLQRDIERLIDSFKRINTLPLGAGAIAGTTYPIDREYIAQLLHFDNICNNSIDAVSDRDFIVEFLSAASLIMVHISRFSEELILWSSQEFSFIEIADTYATGSSMMPQKKNPDVAELGRGKTGRVFGSLMAMLTVLKGLPLTYNKDMQEDKEGLFDTVDTLHKTLKLFSPMVATLQVKSDVMLQAAQSDFSNATDLADYLVKKGMPFRQAHEVVGKIVLACIDSNSYLQDLPFKKYQEYSNLFDNDLFTVLKIENVVNARNVLGGTAKNQVVKQIGLAEEKYEQYQKWVVEKLELYEFI